MADPIVTLTTDFGTQSPFVAAIKGVILSINPLARVVDLSHEIPPFDLRHAAFFLAEALPYFPTGTIHVVVVDPEVGSERNILYVSVAGQRLVVPDNGCWSLLAEGHAQPLRVIRVSEPRYFRPVVSATFHGRDIFAPVAAYLSLGMNPADLGPVVTRWAELRWPTPTRTADSISGEVIFVDHFGNLISNISGSVMANLPADARVTASGVSTRRVRTYADCTPGELVSLVSSSGLLEVAVVQGNAAHKLGARVGTPVHVEWHR
ncbi:MAG: SAM-dependent chlorinase/fluorinase [Gemmataceae bacterium]